MIDVTLETLAEKWPELDRLQRAEVVYNFQRAGISQAKIAHFAGVSVRNIRSRKADANSFVKAGSIPSGDFVDFSSMDVREEVIEEEMDRRDRLQINREARREITNTFFFQEILNLVKNLSEDAKVPVAVYKEHKDAVGEEACIMHWSDLHYCKNINGMSEASVEAALVKYVEDSLKIVERTRKHTKVDKLFLFVNGDMFQNNINYVSAPRETTGSLAYQIVATARLIIRTVMAYLVPRFKKIEIKFLGGNHGKIYHKDDLTTENAEFVMGSIVEAYFESNKTVDVEVGWGSFYKIVDVLGRRIFVSHGDAIAGSGGPEAIINAVKRWDTTGTIAPFDDVLLGHFHKLLVLPIPARYGETHMSRKIIVGGTASRDDSFLTGMGVTPSLQWWLLFCNGKRITALYDMDLYEV